MWATPEASGASTVGAIHITEKSCDARLYWSYGRPVVRPYPIMKPSGVLLADPPTAGTANWPWRNVFGCQVRTGGVDALQEPRDSVADPRRVGVLLQAPVPVEVVAEKGPFVAVSGSSGGLKYGGRPEIPKKWTAWSTGYVAAKDE